MSAAPSLWADGGMAGRGRWGVAWACREGALRPPAALALGAQSHPGVFSYRASPSQNSWSARNPHLSYLLHIVVQVAEQWDQALPHFWPHVTFFNRLREVHHIHVELDGQKPHIGVPLVGRKRESHQCWLLQPHLGKGLKIRPRGTKLPDNAQHSQGIGHTKSPAHGAHTTASTPRPHPQRCQSGPIPRLTCWKSGRRLAAMFVAMRLLSNLSMRWRILTSKTRTKYTKSLSLCFRRAKMSGSTYAIFLACVEHSTML